MSFLENNLGTIVICLILLLLVGSIIRSMIKDKKAGKSSCTHDCSSCGMGSSCHRIQDLKNDFNKIPK